MVSTKCWEVFEELHKWWLLKKGPWSSVEEGFLCTSSFSQANRVVVS
jgi:hypothetical protein